MKRQQMGVIFVAVMFLGSTIGFAFFSAPRRDRSEAYENINYSEYPPTHGTREEEFLKKNIFEEEVPEPIQVNMLTPYNPSNYPNEPYRRVIGGIWIQYSCENCSTLVSKLEEITKQYNPRVYLAPYSKMDSKIALTAYYESNKMEEFNRTAIEDFICNKLKYERPDRCALRETYS